MISKEIFLRCVEKNAERIRAYRLGGDGSDGTCDCIGLIIGALRLAGIRWSGTHGSNWAARNAVTDLHDTSSVSASADTFPSRGRQLSVGEIVFKAREPGQSGYDLPDVYKNTSSTASGPLSPQGEGLDLRDYYHVGVVTQVDPLKITHCTSVSGGIKVDTALGQWKWAGKLKDVDYGEDTSSAASGGSFPSRGSLDGVALYQATVTVQSGKTVNLRKSPSTNAKVIEAVPVDAVVDVMEETNDTWARIDDNGTQGYMMRKFLVKCVCGGEDTLPGRTDLFNDLEDAAGQLRAALQIIDAILERRETSTS